MTTQDITVVITGTNDTPTIVSGSTDSDGAVTEDAAASNLTDTGTIAFEDVDLTDAHTASVTAMTSSHTSQLGTLVPVVTTQTSGGIGGEVTWTFTAANAGVQFLAVGETVTETFTITVDDGLGGTVDQVVTVVITGTNDAAVITSEDLVGAASEDDSTPDLTDSGTIEFDDVDLIDTHSASAAFSGTDNSGGQLGALTASVTTDTSGGTGGQVTWDFVLDNALVQFLAVGETITETYTITLTDGTTGDDITRDVLVTITGTNDAPEITVGGGDSDAESLLETDAAISIGGSLSFSDVDTTDIVGMDSTSTGVVIDGSSTFAGINPLSTGDLQSMFFADEAVVIDGASTASSDGWVFDSLTAGAFDFLATGETLVLVYTVTATDDSGEPNDEATQTVTITITGTNDEPVITAAETNATTLREDGVGVAAVGSVTGDVSSGGNWVDVDNGEQVLLAVTEGSAGGDAQAALTFTGGTGTEAEIVGAYGTLFIEADGSYRYVLDDADADTEALDNGEAATDVFNYTIANGPNVDDEASSTITVNITGSNDNPIIIFTPGVDDTGNVVEAGGAANGVAGTPSATGTLGRSDVDGDDDASNDSWTIIATNGGAIPATTTVVGVYGTFTIDQDGVWTYTLDNDDADTQALGAGESGAEDFVISLSDNDPTNPGVSNSVVVTVYTQGTNDFPVITGATSDSVNETEMGASAAGTVTFTDIDANDAPVVSIGFTSADYTDGLGGPLALSPADETALSVALSVTQTPGNTNNGSASWTYNVADAAVDFLAVGEQIVLTYTATVDDGEGGTNTQTFDITITGTNDAPVISVGGGDSAADTIAETDGGLITSGTLSVADVDVTDTVGVVVTSVAESGDTSGIASGTLLAMLGVDVGDIIDAASTTGAINWDFDSGAEAFDYLADGDTLTLTYLLTVTDSQGVTDTIDVTINVTGTNDAPIANDISAPDVAEGDTFAITLGSAALPIAGIATDVDGPLDTGSFAFTGVTIDGVASTQVLAGISYNDVTGEIDFDADVTAYDHLAVGETDIVVVTYTVTDDFGATDTGTISFNVTGTNDAPTLTAIVDTGAVTETDSANLLASGSFTLADVDVTDLVSVSGVAISATLGALNGLVDADLLGMFSTSGDLDNTEVTGTLSWDFDSLSDTFDYLAAGESLQIDYAITVDDGQGGTDTEIVIVTINGTNDQPEIAAGDTSDLDEIAAITAGAGILSDSGTLTLSDDDATDTHSIADTQTSVVWEGGSGTLGDLSGGLPAGLAVLIDAGFTADNTTTNEDIDWAFALADSEVDFLAAGETLTIIYTITVTDDAGFAVASGNDEQSASATQTVVITITGTNDDPVITSGMGVGITTGSVTEIADLAPGETVDDLTSIGTITFDDVDLSDTHTAVIAEGISGNGAFLGTLTQVLTDSTGTGSGSVDWTYTVNDGDVDFLGAGETITETFTITVSDGAGGTDAVETISVTINGTNDAPTITAESFVVFDQIGAVDATLINSFTGLPEADVDNTLTNGPLVGEPFADDEVYTVTGQLDADDVDDSAVLTFNIDGETISGGETSTTLSAVFNGSLVDFGVLTVASDGSYTFVGNAEALNALDFIPFSHITLSTLVTVTDDQAASATTNFTITLVGDNDDPIAIDDAAMVTEGAISLFNVVFGTTGGMEADFDAESHPLELVSFADLDDAVPFAGATFDGTAVGVTPAVPGSLVTDWGAQITVQSNGLINYNLTSSSASAIFNQLAAGVTAVDTFTYEIEDGNGGTDTATVSVTITGVNDIITANADTIAATENVMAGQSGDLVGNDTDIDVGDSKTIISVVAGANSSVTGVTGGFDVDLGQGVIIHVLSDGSYTIDVPESLSVTDVLSGSFSYTVQDGGGAQSSAIVSFTVNGANDAPIVGAAVDVTATEDDGVVNFDLLDGTTDVDINDTLTVTGLTLVSGDDSGVTINGNDIDVDTDAYTGLALGQFEVIEYSYSVDDGNGGVVAQTATITITGENDAPTVAAALTGAANEDDASFTVDMLDGASDVDTGAVLSVANVVGLTAGVTFAGSTLSVDPADAAFQSLAQGETLAIVISYDVVDEHGASVPQTATITITGTNDAPEVAAALTAAGDEDDAGFSVDMLDGRY